MLHSQIFAVTGRILANQVEFTDAHSQHPRRLVDNAFKAAAAKLAPELGNDTERAGMITPLRDLDVRGVLRRREDARAQIVIEVWRSIVRDGSQTLAKSGDPIEFVGPKYGIHFRDVFLDIGAV